MPQSQFIFVFFYLDGKNQLQVHFTDWINASESMLLAETQSVLANALN